MFNLSALWGMLGALSLISLIWFGGPHIQIAEYKPLEAVWVRIVCSAFIILFVLIINGYKWYKQRQLNKHVMEELKASELAIPSDTSDMERNQLSEQFNSIDLILQKHGAEQQKGLMHRMFMSKNDYLYQKPWFLVVGAPGVGKTTSILNSGLNFPIGTAEDVEKLSGTKDCDWFLTDEAVFLDTAGRFVEQDNQLQNSEDWKELLQLLKRCRTKQPINGLVLVIGADDLLQDGESLQSQLNEFRIRLQELQKSFNTTFPIYLVINKIDLIPGFSQYFAFLSEEERGRVLGVQLEALSANSAEKINYATDKLSEIARLIEMNIFQSVAHNSQINEPSDLALSFPSEFNNFISILKIYLKKLFNLSKYDADLYLSGIYFASSVQQPMALNSAFKKSRFELKAKYEEGFNSESWTQSKPYFINHFYQYVLLEAADLAGVDNNWMKKQRVLYWGACLTLSILAGLLIASFYKFYTKNVDYLKSVQQNIAATEELAKITNSENALELLKLAREVRKIPTNNISDTLQQTGWLNDFGLNKHEAIKNSAILKYKKLIEEHLGGLIANSIEKRLNDSTNAIDHNELYQHLKAYVMLYQNKYYDKKYIAQWTRSYLLTDTASDMYSEEILEDLNNILLEKPVVPVGDYNEELVSRARDILINQDTSSIVYADLLMHFQTLDSKSLAAVSFVSMGGATAQNLFRRVSGSTLNQPISTLYTKYGYENVFLPFVSTRISEFYQKEKWVIGGRDFAISENQALSDVYQRYANDYILAWKEYISDLRMLEPENLQQTIVMSKQLSEKNSALVGIIRGISENTNLVVADKKKDVELSEKEPSDAKLKQAAEQNASNHQALMTGHLQDIAENFSQFHLLTHSVEGSVSQLEEITKSINDLYVYLIALQMSMQNKDALMPDNKPVINYQAQVSRLPDPFRPMLDRFVGQITQSSKEYQESYQTEKQQEAITAEQKTIEAIAQQRDTGVQNTCQTILTNKYPVVKTASDEVSLKELAEIFGKNGIFAKTMNSEIMVDSQPSTLLSALLPNDRKKIYENARAINNKYFAGSDSPGLDFNLKIMSMNKEIKELTVGYDGTKIKYQHGPQRSFKLSWPTNQNTISLKAVTFDNKTHALEIKGEWSLFRLIDNASRTVNTRDGQGIIATFNLNGYDVHIELKAVTGSNLFALDGLRGFAC